MQAAGDRSHPAWLVARQFGVRGMTALKFMLGARLLGPGAIGLVGVALFSVAIGDAASDTGLGEAIVQREAVIDRDEAGAVWTLQLARGLALGALLAVATPWICAYFRVPQALPLLFVAVATLLPGNTLNPGIHLAQRNRDFRLLTLSALVGGVLDLTCGIGLVLGGVGPVGLLIGTLVAACWTSLVSWTWCRIPLAPTLRWGKIRSLTGFGKWVWSTSILTLVLNQADKVIIARLLGPVELGLYQVATKLAQLALVDTAGLFGQYLYPTVAQVYRGSAQAARQYVVRMLRRYLVGMALIAAMLAIFAAPLIGHVFGHAWAGAAPMLRLLAAIGLINALIVVLVVYLRATGRPRWVSHVVTLQLVVMLTAIAPLYRALAVTGLLLALMLSAAVAAGALAWAAFRQER